jgi:hypothetical protein
MPTRDELKRELVTAWRSGAGYERLLAIARLCGDAETDGKAAYGLLQEIWLEAGYDDSAEESQTRDELECALERAWFSRTVSDVSQ